MAFCQKCGAQIADDVKFCDKCGAPTQVMAEPVVNTQAPQKNLYGMVKTYLPANLTTPGDKTMQWIGFGSMAALALTYIICMFVGIDGMSMALVMDANPLWMVIYMFLSVAPAILAGYAFFNPKFKVYSVFAAAFFFVLTLFALICWGIMDEPGMSMFGGMPNAGKLAWYALMDSMADAWYLKFLLPLGVIFGYGVDYLTNNQ